MTVLSDFRTLRQLKLFRISKLDDISFVSTLTGLEKLELIWLANITKIPNLANLNNLAEVCIDTLNKLVDITSLVNAPKLRKVKMLSVKSMTKESVYAVLDNLNVEELLCFGGKAEISDIHINRKIKNKYVGNKRINLSGKLIIHRTLVIMNQKKEILEKLAFIRRHKEFASFGVKEQEVSYNPCLSEEDIKEFEHKHCITLPDDYRTFISEIGNGGFGPGYGLLPLDKAIVDFKLRDKPNISLNEKFPYQDSWNEEWITSFNWNEGYPETEIVNAYISTAHIAGCLQISHFGHGCTFLLVVNGNEKGHIWFDGRADYSGLVPKLKDGQRISFIEWYVTFLDMEIENINESLTHSTTA